jgi:uncharacterized membrane protein YkoI
MQVGFHASAKERQLDQHNYQNHMNITKIMLPLALAAGLFAGCATENAAKLQAEAKVSRAGAEKIALGKVPNGTIKDGELEKEGGKLIWSFDIATSDSKDITEVTVDAKTGEVISAEKETPEEQAREAAEDAAKARQGKKGEDKD